jgi:hypothetical protein
MEYEKFNVIPPGQDTVIDVEAKLEDLFMAAFRAQFEHNQIFTYSDNPKVSKLTITLEYPENAEAPQSKPHILINNITYSMNLDNSMFRNYYQDKFDAQNFNNSAEYAALIPYSITITAIGTSKSISKDLANTLINYMSLTYRKMFDGIGLNIMSINKSSTMGSARYPEKVFETPIQIIGRLEWTGIISTINKTEEHMLESVNIDWEIGSN